MGIVDWQDSNKDGLDEELRCSICHHLVSSRERAEEDLTNWTTKRRWYHWRCAIEAAGIDPGQQTRLEEEPWQNRI